MAKAFITLELHAEDEDETVIEIKGDVPDLNALVTEPGAAMAYLRSLLARALAQT